MFTIRAHGVPAYAAATNANGLSLAQYRLLHDPAPIRVCGAPTGAGKTYAFLQAARAGALVLFVVPTQALASDIEGGAQRQGVPVHRWDGTQSAELRAAGQQPWVVRKLQLDTLQQSGGLIVTTPETLGAILLGKPQAARSPLTLDDFQHACHIVFDEAHTLTARAFGFLHFWAVLVLHWQRTDPANTPKLSLLSATHSNLFEGLCATEPGELSYLPADAVAFFDEQIEHDRPDGLRWLHGAVTVTPTSDDIVTCVQRYAGEPLAQGDRLLVLYDSLRSLTRDEHRLCQQFIAFGVQPRDCFLINGQDRKAGGMSLGGSGCEAGLSPAPRHRVIIATSCIEAGVNIENLRYAILDPGADAAALLQRIGRAARGDVSGQVWLTQPPRQPSHLLRLTELSGELSVGALLQVLAPLRNLTLAHARRLGSAYWSMLRREQRSIYEGLQMAHSTFSTVKAPGGWLNSLHAQAADVPKLRDREKYQNWLKAVDKELADLRGFIPSVRIQFADYPVIEYSRDWALAYLERPERIDEDGVWRYPKARQGYLREEPRPVQVSLLCPRGDTFTGSYQPGVNGIEELKRRYIKCLKQDIRGHRDESFLTAAADFIGATGLLVRVPTQDDSII